MQFYIYFRISLTFYILKKLLGFLLKFCRICRSVLGELSFCHWPTRAFQQEYSEYTSICVSIVFHDFPCSCPVHLLDLFFGAMVNTIVLNFIVFFYCFKYRNKTFIYWLYSQLQIHMLMSIFLDSFVCFYVFTYVCMIGLLCF